MAEQPTIRAVLGELTRSGMVPADAVPRAEEGLTQGASGQPDPWFVQGLVGCGAWIAALFLLGFLAAAHVTGKNADMMVGILLMGSSLIVLRAGGGMFYEQFALALVMAGELLFLFSYGGRRMDFVGFLFPICTLNGLLYWLYPRRSQRFLSGLIGMMILLGSAGRDVSSVVFPFFTLLWGGTMIALYLLPQVPGLFLDLARLSALFLSMTVVWQVAGFHRLADAPLAMSFILAVLTTVAVALIMRRSGRFPLFLQRGMPLVVLLFCSFTHPGIAVALLFLLLGFAVRDRFLWVLGLLELPFFIIHFYYSLEIDLLTKSGILVGSGLLLLLLWGALPRLERKNEAVS